jgi:hypothetical protein
VFCEPLYTEVRRRVILRSSDAGFCINRPPEASGWLLRACRRRAGAPILFRPAMDGEGRMTQMPYHRWWPPNAIELLIVPSDVRSENTPSIRFSTAPGEEPTVELGLE